MIISGFSPDTFRKIYRTKQVKISLDEEQELQVDGEPLGKKKEINAKILPGALEVIMLENSNRKSILDALKT